MRKLVLTCASLLFLSSGFAQTLFTYGTHPVSKQDFVRVYEKNSINKKPDYSETALREYLNLYSLFRMKVKEAELQRLDTLPNIQHELDNYRKQLAKNYLTDEQVTNKLVHEAYDRSKEEIRVAHILIMCPVGADTVAPYQKIDSLYKVALKKKADFAELAKQFSEDKGSKDNGGDIGYITDLSTVYPFENAAYGTPVGKISAPFKTQFGYHIVKVLDRRPASGQIRIAQIMVAVPKSKGPEGIEAGRKRIDSVAMLLKQGVPFEQLVKTYSEDKFTVNEEGKMAPFGVGRYVPAFEDAAFSLKHPGDISAPVQTEYGFHIFKLIERFPIKPYDSVQAQLKHKVDNDSRAQTARDIFFEKIKEKNGFKQYPENLKEVTNRIEAIPDTGKQAHIFKASDFSNMRKPVFTLAGVDYLQSDFAKAAEGITHGRLMGPKQAVSGDLYRMYVNNVVNDFEEHKLIEENPDFKNLMEEYKDGIMLFELMDRNVWGKASKDSAGLAEFYVSHQSKYMWEPGFKGAVYRFKNETLAKEGIKLMNKKGSTDEDVIKKVNNDANPDGVTVQRGHFEFTHFKDVSQADVMKEKITKKPIKNADGTYTVVKVEELYKDRTQKSLEEARGYVVAEYQDYLEKTWNDQLRQKYPVKVDEVVFKSLVK